MKKIFCLFIALICVLSTISCTNGISVSIYTIRLNNEIKNLFLYDAETVSFMERLTYTDREGNHMFTCEYYYEEAQDIYSMYNLCEIVGDYKLYAYEGAVYTETEKGITAVLLLSRTYTDFIDSYFETDFPLDGEKLKQQNSKKEDHLVVAEYHSSLTPQQSAKLESFGLNGTETIVSRYTIEEPFIHSIEYAILENNTEYPIARREFSKSPERNTDIFKSVASLSPSISVDFVFVGNETKGRHFEVPANVYVGIDTADYEYEFFTDEACTIPYSYEDEKINENLVIYVRQK